MMSMMELFIVVAVSQWRIVVVLLLDFLPGTISGGTMKEIHETTTKRPLGRYVCSSTGVRRRIRLICSRRKIRELIMFWQFVKAKLVFIRQAPVRNARMMSLSNSLSFDDNFFWQERPLLTLQLIV